MKPIQSSRSKRIVITRHGETDYNVSRRVQGQGINATLTPRGHKQVTYDLIALLNA
jgi:broad specificity phosphatase PhoE